MLLLIAANLSVIELINGAAEPFPVMAEMAVYIYSTVFLEKIKVPIRLLVFIAGMKIHILFLQRIVSFMIMWDGRYMVEPLLKLPGYI